MTKITICPKCESKIIKNWQDNKKTRYKCLICGRMFNDNTKKERLLLKTDYTIIDEFSNVEDKKKVFDFLFKDLKSKNKFLNRKDIDESLIKWLNINYIKINISNITIENVYFLLLGLKETDRQCKMCGERTKFIGIRNRKIYNVFCSDKCLYKYRSNQQLGENNNIFKMSEKNKKIWKEKLSKSMKSRIQSGEFTPCVTNSWCHSRVETIINGKIIKHRSCWESFFHIKNPQLQFEKIRISYTHENKNYIYIIDFLDNENRILYEIKPRSEKTKLKNKNKRKYANIWAKENNYTYIIIDDLWFYQNYDESILDGQPNKQKLLKNLKQFNENKKN